MWNFYSRSKFLYISVWSNNEQINTNMIGEMLEILVACDNSISLQQQLYAYK